MFCNLFLMREDESVFSHLNLEQKISPFFGQVQLSRCGRYMGKNMVQNKVIFFIIEHFKIIQDPPPSQACGFLTTCEQYCMS